MSELEPHPLADLFPEISEAGYERLRTAIRVGGQSEPIILYEGKILSGRARYRISCELRRAPLLANWMESMGSPLEKLIDDNLRSRELSKSIRAAIAAKITKEVGQAKPGALTIAQAALLLGVSPHSVDAARTILRSGTEQERKALMEGKLSLAPVADDIKRGVSAAQRATITRLSTGRRPPPPRRVPDPVAAPPPPPPRKRRVLTVQKPAPESPVPTTNGAALPVPFSTVQQALWTLIAASAAVSPDQVSEAHVVAASADIERLVLWLMEYGELQKSELERDARAILMQRTAPAEP